MNLIASLTWNCWATGSVLYYVLTEIVRLSSENVPVFTPINMHARELTRELTQCAVRLSYTRGVIATLPPLSGGEQVGEALDFSQASMGGLNREANP